MTIATAIVGLQAIHRAISGVTGAPDGGSFPLPDTVGPSALPLCLLFPSQSDVTPDTQSSAEHIRTYEGIVLCTTDPAGVGVNTSVTAIWALIEAFEARYAALLAADTKVDGRLIQSYHDDGQHSITYRGIQYEGFLFRVQVWS